MRKRRVLLLLCLMLVACTSITFILITKRDHYSTKVSKVRAVSLASANPVDKSIKQGLRPLPGTYEYQGKGTEAISLLGGSKHTFAKKIFAVVSLSKKDSCAWQFNLVMLEEHIEHRTYCTTLNGVVEVSTQRITNFLGYKQTSSYKCDKEGFRLHAGEGEYPTSWSCEEKRGSIIRFTMKNIGKEKLRILNKEVNTSHIRVIGRQRNKGRGDEVTDLWLFESGLPAKMVTRRSNMSNAGPLGTMRLTEQYSYSLTSTITS